MTCTCTNIPHDRRVEFWSTVTKKLVHVTHRDCAEHGVVVGPSLPMRLHDHQGWLTVEEFMGVLARKLPFKVLEKAKDGQTALVEWSIWEPMGEEVAA